MLLMTVGQTILSIACIWVGVFVLIGATWIVGEWVLDWLFKDE